MTQIQLPHAISPQDLMQLGLQEVAYVKPVQIDGENVVTVHAADGTQIAVMPDRESAFAAVRQHDMEPVSVH